MGYYLEFYIKMHLPTHFRIAKHRMQNKNIRMNVKRKHYYLATRQEVLSLQVKIWHHDGRVEKGQTCKNDEKEREKQEEGRAAQEGIAIQKTRKLLSSRQSKEGSEKVAIQIEASQKITENCCQVV